MKLARIGLTGASGMLGRHVLAQAQTDRLECFAASRSRPALLPPTAKWSHWDLGEAAGADELERIFPRIDALIHAGAVVPAGDRPVQDRALFDVNVRTAYEIGRWCAERGVPMVYISGATVYADPYRSGIREDDAKTAGPCAGGLYGLSKHIAELALVHLRAAGLGLISLRPSSIYGNGLPRSKMVTSFLERAKAGETIALVPPVEDSFDLVHASDVARAALLALRFDARGEYNVGGGALTTVEELARVCVATAASGRVEICGSTSGRAARAHFGLDCGKARRAFGYVPEVSVADGIARMFHADFSVPLSKRID